MRAILACLLAVCIDDAAAQIVSRDSVHLKPIGSVVRGSVVLVNKTVPLPPGEFKLVATAIRESKMTYGDYAGQSHKLVDVMLGEVADGRLRIGVIATTVLSAGRARWEWTDEPCRRDDTLFRLNRVPFMKRNYSQDCLLVNHYVNSLGQSATGIYATAAAWVKDQGGATPIPTLIYATITRIELGEYLNVHYAFNPEAYGCDPAPAGSWMVSDWHRSRIGNDPAKARFVAGVVDFGKDAQVRVNEAFEGRRDVAERLAAATPQVRPCGKG